MKLFELDASEISTGYYDPNADRISGRRFGDTRKPELTLKLLNRLKKIRAQQKLEDLKREDLMAVMYGAPDQEGGGGGMGGMF